MDIMEMRAEDLVFFDGAQVHSDSRSIKGKTLFTPNSAFWEVWHEKKEDMKRRGVRVWKDDSGWHGELSHVYLRN